MNEEKDIWNKTLKDRARDFKMQVDDDVWKRIESDLPVPKTGLTRRIRTVASVAAALLVLLLVGRLLLPEKTPDKDRIEVSEKENTLHPAEENNETLTAKLPVKEIDTPRREKKADNKKTKPIIADKTVDKQNDLQTRRHADMPPTEKESVIKDQNDTPADKKELTEEEARERKIRQEQFAVAGQELPDTWFNVNKSKKSPRKMSLALAVGNQTSSFSSASPAPEIIAVSAVPSKMTLNGGVSSESVKIESQAFSKNETLGIANTEQEETPTTTEIDYKTPVTLGVMVRKSIGDSRWALETGINYTRLESTEKLNYANSTEFSKDVEMDYLGIPLKVVCEIYQTGRLSIYATAGAQVEKAIHSSETRYFPTTGEIGKESLNVSELQWSLMGNIGINCNIVENIGLFVEPGVQYFFDDKSGVQTIRKDKPFNFGLQIGLRLNY